MIINDFEPPGLFPARLPTQNAPSGEALICELLQHHPQDLHAMAPVRKANE